MCLCVCKRSRFVRTRRGLFCSAMGPISGPVANQSTHTQTPMHMCDNNIYIRHEAVSRIERAHSQLSHCNARHAAREQWRRANRNADIDGDDGYLRPMLRTFVGCAWQRMRAHTIAANRQHSAHANIGCRQLPHRFNVIRRAYI